MWPEKTKKISLVIIAVAAFAAALLAIRFSTGHSDSARAELLQFVPADTTSVIFVDLDQLRTSPFLATIYSWAPHSAEDSDYTKFVNDTGFNYERDLAQVFIAVSNHGGSSNTLVVADGRFDRRKIEAYLGCNSAAAQQANLKIFRIPAWIRDKSIFFSFLSDHRIAIADSENLAALLSAAKNKSAHAEWQTRFDRLAGSPLLVIVRQDPTVQAVFASESPQLASLIERLPWITLAGKPNGNFLQLVVEGESPSDAMASQLSEFLRGIQLLAQNGLNDPQLRQRMNPDERNAYLELLQGAQIDKIGRGDSKSVRVVLPITPQFLQIAKAPTIKTAPDSAADPPPAAARNKAGPQQAKPTKRK
ncbi:MAG TPA: hypothetical protein VFN20_03550 [Candidatus Acidoferrum sp.]|nr:hypothetical protein [Candidatus Acidoferrum sp.]